MAGADRGIDRGRERAAGRDPISPIDRRRSQGGQPPGQGLQGEEITELVLQVLNWYFKGNACI